MVEGLDAMKRRNKIKFHIKSREGSTMIEVLVAIIVVVLMVGMFGTTTTLAIDFLVKTRTTLESQQVFFEEYRKTTPSGETATFAGKFILKADMTKNQNSMNASTDAKEIPLTETLELKSYRSDMLGDIIYYYK